MFQFQIKTKIVGLSATAESSGVGNIYNCLNLYGKSIYDNICVGWHIIE